MERITKSDLDGAFRGWVAAIGAHVADSYDDAGGMQLAQQHGRWVIEQILNDEGVIHYPLGNATRTTRELHDTLWFARDSMILAQARRQTMSKYGVKEVA